jgi:hypothetical protein
VLRIAEHDDRTPPHVDAEFFDGGSMIDFGKDHEAGRLACKLADYLRFAFGEMTDSAVGQQPSRKHRRRHRTRHNSML